MSPTDDDRLAALLSDAVSDVEPGEALDTLRDRVKVTSMSARRPWLYAVGGAIVATAATITAVAVLTGGEPATAPPVNQPSSVSPSAPDSAPDSEATDDPTDEPIEDPVSQVTMAVYYVGDTPEGPRLYREFRYDESIAEVQNAVSAAISGTPLDADYRTLWPRGSTLERATWDGDVARIDVSGVPGELPSDMTDEEARLAIQQVIYTAQAAIGEGRVPVQLTMGGNPVASLLGQPTSEPLANDSILATLARVSLTDPSEAQVVTGDTLAVSGVANSFEANVVIRLQRWEGTQILFEEPLIAEGYMADKLFPFEAEFDISDVPPGDYVLIAMTDDPSGNGMSHTDTKRITVQ